MTTLYKDVKPFLPSQKGKRFEVAQFDVTKEKLDRVKLQALFSGHGGEYSGMNPGKYIRLVDTERQEVVMSDTPMELRTNREFVENAKGRVLVGGLGLGIVLMAIQSKPEVTEIVVVEKFSEVIRLVGKRLPLNKKVRIIKGDILEMKPEKGAVYDTIYFDIWNHITSDNWEQMKTLKRTWRKALAAGGWIASWRDKDCQRIAAEERRDERMWG